MRSYYTIGRFNAVANVSKTCYRVYTINRIWVAPSHRGKGFGSQVMQKVLADADAQGITLRLLVAPQDGLKYEELVAWYERCGFVQSDSILVYYRQPKRVRLPAMEGKWGVARPEAEMQSK